MRCRGLIALLIWGQSVAAADLGTWGDLWPVKEPDMLTVIMQRLTALEQSGEMGRKMDAFKERVIRNSLRPPAVPGIGRTEKYGSRLFDPSVRLAADKDSGWGQDIGLAKCSSDEKALAKAKSNKLTVSVGEFCSKKVLGVCLEKKRSYCQFDSKLAQIVQQQGRNGQLRISFGSAKHPDCRGITVDELQKIQFNRLDFTNFYEDLMNNQKIPDSGVLTQKVKEQIADQLKQAGQ